MQSPKQISSAMNLFGYDYHGTTIACAMDLFTDKSLRRKIPMDPLHFGDAETMVKLIAWPDGAKASATACRRILQTSEKIWASGIFYDCKKQEMPAYDHVASRGLDWNFATANCGAAHVRVIQSPGVLGNPFKVDQHTTDGKPALVKTFQDLTAALDQPERACLLTFVSVQQN